MWTKHASFYFMCLTPVIIALFASLSLSSLPGFGLRREERVAVAIETSYQVVSLYNRDHHDHHDHHRRHRPPPPPPPPPTATTCRHHLQNVGLATAISLSMFDGPDAAKALHVPLTYGGFEIWGTIWVT